MNDPEPLGLETFLADIEVGLDRLEASDHGGS
jgi:hypothetical protein